MGKPPIEKGRLITRVNELNISDFNNFHMLLSVSKIEKLYKQLGADRSKFKEEKMFKGILYLNYYFLMHTILSTKIQDKFDLDEEAFKSRGVLLLKEMLGAGSSYKLNNDMLQKAVNNYTKYKAHKDKRFDLENGIYIASSVLFELGITATSDKIQKVAAFFKKEKDLYVHSFIKEEYKELGIFGHIDFKARG